MKNKSLILFLILILVSALLYGCSVNNEKNTNHTTNMNHASTLTTKKVDINKYKYMNAIAGFNCSFKDGYVYFSDEDYDNEEEYTGKVRWGDEKTSGKIIGAWQVISSNGKEIYSKQLKIMSGIDENSNANTWDYYTIYEPSIKAKCDSKHVECYIKLVDNAGIEYHTMLTPIERFNKDGYAGAAIYIIDPNNNVEFWYDDMIE